MESSTLSKKKDKHGIYTLGFVDGVPQYVELLHDEDDEGQKNTNEKYCGLKGQDAINEFFNIAAKKRFCT